MRARLRSLAAGTGFGLFAAGSLFAAAVALAFADLWLPAVGLLGGVTYVAGRWDRLRDRLAAFTVLRAERDRAVAEAAGLRDELTYRWDRAHAGRYADDGPRFPGNGAGHYTAAALYDRNSNTTATTDSGVPAPARATNLP